MRVAIGERVGSNVENGVILVCFVGALGTEAFVSLVDVGEVGYAGQFVEVGISAKTFGIAVVGDYWNHHVGGEEV